MPMYWFLCSDCGNEWEKLLTPDQVVGLKPRCPRCHSTETGQNFSRKRTNVTPDEFATPLRCDTMLSVKTDDPRNTDYAHSRSELQRMMKDHDRKYGTELVQRK